MIRNEETSEIHIRLMGEVQTEVLQKMVKDRFGVLIHFGEGRIVYKETIKNSVKGQVILNLFDIMRKCI